MSHGLLLTFEITILVLAIFLGFEVISKVPTLLHTPLMSGTNAINGIVIVGAMLVAGLGHKDTLTTVVGLIAVVLASANVVLLAIDRSLSAWQTLAAGSQAPRVDALVEILEALRTAVELRFPDAGDAISAREIGSDDSGDECAGERP